jgi:iron(III) transport system substrate-binding protein
MLAIATAMTLVLLACAPAAAPTQYSVPSTQDSSSPSAAPAQAEWEQTIAAAKREGKLVILGPPGTDPREALTTGFHARYPEIQVEFVGATGAQTAPKVLAERQAGHYLSDIHVGGTTTMLASLGPAGALDPILPYLVGPESRDTSQWLDGKLDFADNDARYNVVYSSAAKAIVIYNSRLVNAGELKSFRDLLDPRWRGKVVVRDPRSAGSGLATGTFFYTTPSLGPDYLRQLFASGVAYSVDDRQVLEWVARGQYPISVGGAERDATEMRKKGLPLSIVDGHDFQEGTYLTSATGSVGILNRAPHPNAVKVYLDWLLSREAQMAWSVASGFPSRRLDVPTDHLEKANIPRPGVQYQENYKEPYVMIKAELDAFFETEIPR